VTPGLLIAAMATPSCRLLSRALTSAAGSGTEAMAPVPASEHSA